MRYDFGGYATRNDLRCSDGRTIRKDAFKDCDGKIVPLVWNHNHETADNILGHALLENRSDGVYAYGVFNDTEQGRNAKDLVAHGDVTALSIYANQLQQKPGANGGRDVVHGVIREVSLVLAGANPGASIDSVAFEHGDGSIDEEGVIYSGEYFSLDVEKNDTIEHAESKDEEEKPEEEAPKQEENEEKEAPVANAANQQQGSAGSNEKTVQDVYDSMTEEQKTVVDYLVGLAIQDAKGEDVDDDEEMQQSFEGDDMGFNVFEGSAEGGEFLSHAQTMELFDMIMADAKGYGSFRDSMLAHAADYGIDNIDVLFPDAQNIRQTPDFIKRETAWVATVMNGTKHVPFSRIRSTTADITADEARAKGYVKGTQKLNEVISVAKRETTPQTVYKKQKLDRDDIIDITSFDVVAWLWSEMRIMLDEEIARAILIGDGRLATDPDKIKETNIRPIVSDNDLYTLKENISDAAHTDWDVFIEEVSKANKNYRGSGNPVFFCSPEVHSEMLWVKDRMGRKIYESDTELCSALRVKEIVEVPQLADYVVNYNTVDFWVKGIKVNLIDYSVGTDRGGQVSQFEDFDIDYNQQKYLLETRLSGAMTLPQAAQVFRHVVTYTAVENPVAADLGIYYERTGAGTAVDPYVYTLTEDTTIDAGSTYYTRS